MANTLMENVELTANMIEQIVTYDIAGKPGSEPSDYSVTLMLKTFCEYSDGGCLVNKTERFGFNVGEALLDSEGVVIQSRLDLMNNFMDLMYEIIDEQRAGES